jgi:hypothetical protein
MASASEANGISAVSGTATELPWPRYHADGRVPLGNVVWVFGSNTLGRHGAGAALVAVDRFDAVRGVGEGPTGRAYAIPTKDDKLRPRSLPEIRVSVERFKRYAQDNHGTRFFLTRVGCGLAAFRDEDIAPMFAGVPDNCSLPEQWAPYIHEAV